MIDVADAQIHSVHFVSLDLLLDPAARTYEYVNTSKRLLPTAHPWLLKFLHLMLGDMKFSAIKLRPTASVPDSSITLQLHLWGLTLGALHRPLVRPLTAGVLTDFLDLLPPHSSRMLWTFPTYSMPDVALLTFLFTVSSRGKARAAGRIAADATTGPDGFYPLEESFLTGSRGTMNWVGNSLEGYYTNVRRAIYLSLVLRGFLMGWIVRLGVRRLMQAHRR